jgi:hypothetical protein
MRPLSENMRRTLIDIGHGRSPFGRCEGRSEHGGQHRALDMLVRRGLVAGNGVTTPYRLTPEGLAVVWGSL